MVNGRKKRKKDLTDCAAAVSVGGNEMKNDTDRFCERCQVGRRNNNINNLQ